MGLDMLVPYGLLYDTHMPYGLLYDTHMPYSLLYDMHCLMIFCMTCTCLMASCMTCMCLMIFCMPCMCLMASCMQYGHGRPAVASGHSPFCNGCLLCGGQVLPAWNLGQWGKARLYRTPGNPRLHCACSVPQSWLGRAAWPLPPTQQWLAVSVINNSQL